MATFRRPMTTLATAALITTSAFGLSACGNPEEDIAQSVTDYYTFMTTGLTKTQVDAVPEDALNEAPQATDNATGNAELCSADAREKMSAYLTEIGADKVINTAALDGNAACAYPAFVVSSKITLVDPEQENKPTITVQLDDDAITIADDKKHATIDASKVHLVITPPANTEGENKAENAEGAEGDTENADGAASNTDAAAPTTVAAAELVPSATQATSMGAPGPSTVTFTKTDQGWRYDPTSDADALVKFLESYTNMIDGDAPEAPEAPAPDAPTPDAPDAEAPMPLPETDPEMMH